MESRHPLGSGAPSGAPLLASRGASRTHRGRNRGTHSGHIWGTTHREPARSDENLRDAVSQVRAHVIELPLIVLRGAILPSRVSPILRRLANVNSVLTVSLLAAVNPYSSEVRQPTCARAILGMYRHTSSCAFNHRQSGADSAQSLTPPSGWSRRRSSALHSLILEFNEVNVPVCPASKQLAELGGHRQFLDSKPHGLAFKSPEFGVHGIRSRRPEAAKIV